MASFDTNLMLRNTTETIGTNLSLTGDGLIRFTSNWLTLGTNVRGPVPLRISFSTVNINVSTMDFHFEQSDDQTNIKEDTVVYVNGTDLGAPNLGWTTLSRPDKCVAIYGKRRYLRVRAVGGAGAGTANWGTMAIGVDAEGLDPVR